MNNLLRTTIFAATLFVFAPTVSAQDYNKGLTFEQAGDYAAALGEWRPLAEQRHADAQNNLGAMYSKGDGVLRDSVFAHMWYNISSANGSEFGRKNLDIVAKRMTWEQIADATQRARTCMASSYADCD